MAIANISGNILTDSGVATSSLLPLTGGTLTGALSGTSATFSSTLSVTGNTGIGVAADTNVRLEIKGSNTSGGHYIFYTMDSASSPLFTLQNNGAATFSSNIQSGNISIPTPTTSESSLYLQTPNSDLAVAAYQSTYTGVANYASKSVIQAGNGGSGTGQLLLSSWETGGIMTFYTGGRTSGYERMRITSGGLVLINTTTSGNGQLNVHNTASTFCINVVDAANTGNLQSFKNSSLAQVGSISENGTSTQFNTTSDYRLKEDFKEVKGLENLSAIKVYDFKFKNSKNRMDGVIAHELQEIIPYAVVGKKDAVNEDGSINPQGVDYSMIVPTLVKAIQEQNQIIQELNERLNKAGL